MIPEALHTLLPQYDGIAQLAYRAQEINTALAQGQISLEEHHALLEDLTQTQLVLDAANDQNQRILLDQIVQILKSVPLP